MKKEIEIIFEDKDVIIINKPAGLVVHSDGRTKERTLVDWILETHPDMKGIGEPIVLSSGESIDRPGIVHRLDRDTSGVLVIAKNQNSFLNLKRQFQDHVVKKVYRTFVYGVMSEDDGIIDRPITRSRKDFRLWSAQRGGRGEAREAVTAYEVLNRGSDATYVEVKPRTGRTHQIRVHMKAINHPVVADRLYAPKRDPILGFERLALHALKLSFVTLMSEEVTFEAPLPSDFIQAEKLLNA